MNVAQELLELRRAALNAGNTDENKLIEVIDFCQQEAEGLVDDFTDVRLLDTITAAGAAVASHASQSAEELFSMLGAKDQIPDWKGQLDDLKNNPMLNAMIAAVAPIIYSIMKYRHEVGADSRDPEQTQQSPTENQSDYQPQS